MNPHIGAGQGERAVHAARLALVVAGYILTAGSMSDPVTPLRIWLPLGLVVAVTAALRPSGRRRRLPLWAVDLVAVFGLRMLVGLDEIGEPLFAVLAVPLVAGAVGRWWGVAATMVGAAVSYGMVPSPEADRLRNMILAVLVLGFMAGAAAFVSAIEHRQRTAAWASERLRLRLQAVLSAVVQDDDRGVVVRDDQGRLVEVNDAARDMVGLTADTILGTGSIFRGPVLDLDGAPYGGPLPDERAQETGETAPEEVIGIGDDLTRWTAVRSIPVEHEEGRWSVTLLRDVTDETRTLTRLHRLAAIDPLTQVGNRRFLEWIIADMDDPDEHVVVLALDLDDFKDVNDAHGHDVGDEILVGVAERLLACVRAVDAVVRLGGDEFLVILRDIATVDAEDTQRRIEQTLAAPYTTRAGLLDVTASVGTATGSATAPWTLLRHADSQMYENKRERAAVSAPVRLLGGPAANRIGP